MTAPRDDSLSDDPALAEALSDWRTRGRLSNEAVRAMKTRRRRIATGVAGGAAMLLLAVGMSPYRFGPAPARMASLQTGRGETRSVRLPDGTTMRLDGATRLTVRYGDDERVVALATGAVFFDVAHDPQRPFTVRAGDGDVRVLGTAFDVDRMAGRMEVLVYRGAVRLAGRRDDRGEWIPAGYRSHVIRGHAGPAAPFDTSGDDRHGAWLDTDGLRLADLVSVLNRRRGQTTLPPPASLADLPIGGRFRIDDSRSLLTSLGITYGFHVTSQGDMLTLSSKPSKTVTD